jgi:hypothetical protein
LHLLCLLDLPAVAEGHQHFQVEVVAMAAMGLLMDAVVAAEAQLKGAAAAGTAGTAQQAL